MERKMQAGLKYFHLQTSFGCSFNMFLYKGSTVFVPIWAPQTAPKSKFSVALHPQKQQGLLVWTKCYSCIAIINSANKYRQHKSNMLIWVLFMRTIRDGESRTFTSTFTQLLSCMAWVQCCFTSTETIRTIRDGESRTFTSTFTQLLSCEFNVALRPQRP